MKIRPVEAELFHAEGRTDMTKLKLVFEILQMHLKWLACSAPFSPLAVRVVVTRKATGSSARPSSDCKSKCRYSDNLLNPKRWNCLNLYKRNFPQRTIPQISFL